MTQSYRQRDADRFETTGDGVEILFPEIFRSMPGLIAGVTTRRGGVSPEPFGMNISAKVGDDPAAVDANRRRAFAAFGVSERAIAHPGQVHSDRIERVSGAGRVADCDALMTTVPGLFLAVTIADCVPILLHDPVSGLCAAVHSGWRGSAENILGKSIAAILRAGLSRAEHLRAYIGPSAGVCCYEVGEEVAARFDRRFVVGSGNGRLHVDLKIFNRSVLLSCGIPEDQIDCSRHCTICEGEHFHSYRRERERSGRMMALIGRRAEAADERRDP